MIKKKNLIHIQSAKAITPSMRHYKYITKYLLTKQSRILKAVTFKIRRAFGKSSFSGRTILWGRHSGSKKLYRQICFFNQNTLGIILFSIYDPNRTIFLSAIFDFFSFQFYYIPSIQNVFPGSFIGCKENRNYKYALGFRYVLNQIGLGLNFCLVSIKPNKIAQIAKAAGVFCQMIKKVKNLCKIRLPSGQMVIIPSICFVTLGVLSNKYNRYIIIGKAGRNILNGAKPTVRGIAMNPVDNPHGGRTNGGCSWVTPWGKPFLFKKTSTSKKNYKKYIKIL